VPTGLSSAILADVRGCPVVDRQVLTGVAGHSFQIPLIAPPHQALVLRNPDPASGLLVRFETPRLQPQLVSRCNLPKCLPASQVRSGCSFSPRFKSPSDISPFGPSAAVMILVKPGAESIRHIGRTRQRS
jgi:hypothetical protein